MVDGDVNCDDDGDVDGDGEDDGDDDIGDGGNGGDDEDYTLINSHSHLVTMWVVDILIQ